MFRHGNGEKSPGKIIRSILIIFCILVVLGCAVYLAIYLWHADANQSFYSDTADKYVSQSEETPENSTPLVDDDTSSEAAELPVELCKIDFQALQAESPNVCAWITVSGIEEINYPVVWCGDDSFYLTHGWDNSARSCGAIFLEGQCAEDLSDAYLLIYGHYMRNGTMFGSLEQYADEDFYRENGGYISIYQPDETCIYRIYSARYVSPTDETAYRIGFAHDDVYAAYVAAQCEASLYDTGIAVSALDQVVTLSTCANSGRDRFVVHAVLQYTVPTR